MPVCLATPVTPSINRGSKEREFCLAPGTSVVLSHCCLQVLLERLRLRVGDAGPDAELYRTSCLKAMLPQGGAFAARKVVLALLPNGDWRKRDVVELFLPPEQLEQADRGQLAAGIADASSVFTLVDAGLARKKQ